ncbi:MAG: hypothetical protein KA020_13635 [Planctomycetes bacterium]|nr:hypothetical protein [Planctomycetota bacterium]
MKNPVVALCLCSAVASLSAQNYLELPVSATPSQELQNYSLLPLMQVNSRVQMFYTATEVGSPTFTANQLEFRFDGPVPQVGAPGPFLIQRLQISIGVSTIAMPGARYADNLTQPLVPVFDGPWSFYPDPGSASPHPWGAPNGSLTFPFTVPASVTIPNGGWLVVDLVMEGNNIANFGYSHALLDGATTTGGVVDGQSMPFGQGCSLGTSQPTATMAVTGTRAPGAAFFLNATNLAPNSPAFALFGLSNTVGAFGPLPYNLAGSSCNFLTSIDFSSILLADAAGSITGSQAGASLAVPADPGFAGLNLFAQVASYAPGANPWDVVLTDGTAITLGSIGTLGRGTYLVGNGDSATSPIATSVKPFGFAMRLRTL